MQTALTEETRLPVHEWIAILAICSLLISLTVICLFFKSSNLPKELGTPHYTLSQEIEVFVEGAVEKPGKYQVKRGALLSDVLSQVTLADDADLRRIKTDKRVKDRQVIKIPHIPKISVQIEGAVEMPGKLTLAKGARLCDLVPLIQFHSDADIAKLQKKRRLKDGEVITVKKMKS